MSIMGAAAGLPTPRADWAQTDESRADFIRNKPDVEAIRTMAQEGNTLARNALPKTGGFMQGNIQMNSHIIKGLSDPVDLHDAATKTYVDSKLVEKTATIPTSGWETWSSDGVTFGYVNVDITGMLASDSLIVDYDGSKNSSSSVIYQQLEWWSSVYKVSSMDGKIRVYATEVPTEEIPIKLMVVR